MAMSRELPFFVTATRVLMPSLDESIRVRYQTAHILIAVLVSISALLIQNILNTQQLDAKVINLSGQQRMLSQKIALHVTRIFVQGDRNEIEREDLAQSVKKFKENHYALIQHEPIQGKSHHLSSELQALYFSGNPSLHQRVLIYAEQAEMFLSEGSISQGMFNESRFTNELLVDLNKVVEQFETEARRRVTFLSRSEIVLWIMIMCLLIAELLIIFRPLERKIATLVESLEQKRRTAESSVKAKSEFVANMSHEILTPMHGVLGMLKILGKSNLADAQVRYLNLAQENADALLKIIKDILDLSKINAGKLGIKDVDFDVRVLLEDVTNRILPRIEEKGLKLNTDVGEVEHNLLLNGDPDLITQVLTRLVDNAIKFTPEGEITISAHLQDMGARGVILACSVTDTGIGIDESIQDRLFEQFAQADSSNTK